MAYTRVTQALLARIASSSHTLTIHFPAVRVAVSGSGPSSLPVSPLTGEPIDLEVVQPDDTPVQAPKTISCLWLDVKTVTDAQRKIMAVSGYGWNMESDALVQVAASDVVDGDATILDTAAYVEHGSSRYQVLKVVPVGSSYAPTGVYAVWVKGMLRQ